MNNNNKDKASTQMNPMINGAYFKPKNKKAIDSNTQNSTDDCPKRPKYIFF
jgi:hypothetical protein